MKGYLVIYGLFVTSVLLVRCDKRYILASESKSWISDKDLTKIIKLSLSLSKCCNIFFDGFSMVGSRAVFLFLCLRVSIWKLYSESREDSKALFNQFRNIYPFEYLLKRSTDECNGYFLLGSSDSEIVQSMKKIPSLLWNTEILIIVNDNIYSNSSILNTTMYGISNVNIVSMLGIWKLSENYLKPRVFVKLNGYEKIHRDDINFHGRELQVCSIHQPPMTYLNHTIQKTIDGVQAEVFTMNTDLDWDGIETRLFLIMAEKMNFTWTIRKPEGNYTYGRRINDTVWKGGMIEMLRDHKVDMAFAGIWVTHDQNKFVNLSEPWYQVYIHFLVPRFRRTTSFWALAKPFSGGVWLLFTFMFLLYTIYICICAWVDPKFPKRFRNFLITFIDLIGYFLSSSVPKDTTSYKLQVIFWRTAGWLIITAYSSSLAARLSSSDYHRVDTVKQFLDANLTWGRTGQVPPFRDFFDLTDPYSAQLPNKYRHIENVTQTKELIMKGNYAILGQVVDRCFFPSDYVENTNLKNYRLMKESVGHFYAAFAVQPWLLKSVNRIMLWLKESGITIWHLRDVIRRRNNYNLHEVLLDLDGYDGSAQVLGLTPLGAGFSILFVGSLTAILVFYLELKRAAGPFSVFEYLCKIHRKRRFRNTVD